VKYLEIYSLQQTKLKVQISVKTKQIEYENRKIISTKLNKYFNVINNKICRLYAEINKF